MIPRYTTPEMAELWDERTKLKLWLEIELLALEAQAEQELVPRAAVDRIRARARVPDPERVRTLEEMRTRHDVVAFLEVLSEELGDDARYVHRGLGSSDIVDTATSVLLVRAVDLLLRELERVQAACARLADAHRTTLMTGRTHGMAAEPTTFGLKVANWLAELQRDGERLRRAREVVGVGKLSGEVGNYAHLPPSIEASVCARLGLRPDPVSSQILQRDRHAELLCAIAITAGTLERITTEIRNLQRTEIRELTEPFAHAQAGSSAMPHKRNPILCERITGLARMLRASALVALENQALWGERDITHSSNERITLPGATTLLHYALRKTAEVLEGLGVDPDAMRRNLERTGGLVYSHRVLLALTDRGMPRAEAYRVIQRAAQRVEEDPDRGPDAFLRVLLEEPAVRAYLDEASLCACFDPTPYVRFTDEILARLGIPPQGGAR